MVKAKKRAKHKVTLKVAETSEPNLSAEEHAAKKSEDDLEGDNLVRSQSSKLLQQQSSMKKSVQAVHSSKSVEVDKAKSQKSLKSADNIKKKSRSKHMGSRMVTTKVSDSSLDYDSSSSDEEELEFSESKQALEKMASVVLPGKKKGKKKGGKKKAEKPEEGEGGEDKEKTPKKGAKKKGKKGAEEPKEEQPIVEEPEVDIMAEINRMKALAEAQAAGEDLEMLSQATSKKSDKPKKKKGPKKKLSKKEKARLAAEQAEKARIEAELEAARAAEEERIRLEEERKAAIEKEKREIVEQQIRIEQLESSNTFINSLVNYNLDLAEKTREQMEWELYVNCGKLPNPAKCDQMNTYLHLWEKDMEQTMMEDAAKKTVDVLELLNDLDNLIDTATDEEADVIDNWKWVRLLFRQHQAQSLDVATYRLLRDIEKNLNRIDIPTADYKYKDDNLTLCLWLRIQLPTPLPNPRRPAKPRIEIDFEEMEMSVQFPISVDCDKMAIRAAYLKYDHLSDLCETYHKPPIPQEYEIDLYGFIKVEWREKLRYKYDNRVIEAPPPPKEEEEVDGEGDEVKEKKPVEPPKELGPDDEIPFVPYRKLSPTASEFVVAKEDLLYAKIRGGLIKTVPDDEINLRRFSIIGGVYMLNLIHQPPQPQDFVTMEMNITPLYIPKQLEFVDFYVEYEPPAPPEPGVRRLPEEIEEEMKKQEEELDQLMLITLTWPDHVIFLELPLVCHWDESRQVWARRDIHDLKHNEEKGQLTFRTGKFGTFALAAYRYANLPYQAWEIRPEANGTVSLQITAAILMVEFNVDSSGRIALSQLQNSPNNAMQDVVGTYFKLPKLMRMMQSCGVDVFPAFDAFCYVDGTCEKHWPLEKHLYFNMAQLSICFNFAWSRWNLPAGRRNVVMQMREYNFEKVKQKNHSMLHVTPLKAIYVDCTEVSQTFNEEGIGNMKFYSDLYYLMKGTSNMAVRNKISGAPKELVYSLYELLISTRIVSFS